MNGQSLPKDPALIQIIVNEAATAKKEFRPADLNTMIGLYAMHLREQMVKADDFRVEDLAILPDKAYTLVSQNEFVAELLSFISYNGSIRKVDVDALDKAQAAFSPDVIQDIGYAYEVEIQRRSRQ